MKCQYKVVYLQAETLLLFSKCVYISACLLVTDVLTNLTLAKNYKYASVRLQISDIYIGIKLRNVKQK